MTTIHARTAEREDFLATILTTAVEGGIGYWSQCREYRWYFPDLPGGSAEPAPSGGANAMARIIDAEDVEHVITLDTIELGLDRIERGRPEFMTERAWRTIRYCNRHNNTAPDDAPSYAGDIDADYADQILQVGALGTLVYG